MVPGAYFGMELVESEDTHIVRMHGELDIANADQVRHTLVGVAGSTVVADLSGLTFIDASGLSAFVSARKQIADQGHSCRITGARSFVRRVFQLCDLDGLLDD